MYTERFPLVFVFARICVTDLCCFPPKIGLLVPTGCSSFHKNLFGILVSRFPDQHCILSLMVVFSVLCLLGPAFGVQATVLVEDFECFTTFFGLEEGCEYFFFCFLFVFPSFGVTSFISGANYV